MGKNRKAQNNSIDDDNVHIKISKKKRKNASTLNVESKHSKDGNRKSKPLVSEIPPTSNTGKPKKIIFVEDEPQEVPIAPLNKNKTPKKRNSEQSVTTISPRVNGGDSKKIKFVKTEPQDVPAVSKSTSKAPKKRNKQNTDDSTKEDIQDEDIDKFCDELDEEQNKQYETWVQLIEANLNSNKKKT